MEFDYDYFDNPDADGYQGYAREAGKDQPVASWDAIAVFCLNEGIASAIDVGCAKGFLVEALLRHGISAVGYDVSDYALGFAKDLPCSRRDVREGIPGAADAVFAANVLQYVHETELEDVLQSIHRATRRLFFFSSYYQDTLRPASDPLRRIERPLHWWRARLLEAGFAYRSRGIHVDVYTRLPPPGA